MFIYFIAGIPKCPDFGHAKLVAEKLKQSLPDFSYKVIVKTEKEYQNWLRKFCNEQKWKIDENPLVWKRTRNLNGVCHLIGGINEFFEHLDEYYNIDTRLDRNIKKHIALDNQERMPLMLTEQTPVERPSPRRVCITGVIYPSTSYLVSELLQLKHLHTDGGITICLHQRDVNKYGDLLKIKNEMSDAEFNVHGHRAIMAINSVEEGLLNCDLLIVIGSVKRIENENHYLWMNRNYSAMKSLASILNHHCPERCKVLLTGTELLCFNLSVLAENAFRVYLYNIIGVTGHYGMETIPTISWATGIPVSDLHCPPVWGFIGSEQFIDVDHVVYHMGKRSAGSTEESTVDDSTVHCFANRKHCKYLRRLLLQSADLSEAVNSGNHIVGKKNTPKSVKTECPASCLPEVRATVRVISEWFKKKSNVTISAAVFSDGTFGLPFGMFMSQPVHMENDEWKPNYEFPSPDRQIIFDIVSKVKDILTEFNLGTRFYMNLKESKSRISE